MLRSPHDVPWTVAAAGIALAVAASCLVESAPSACGGAAQPPVVALEPGFAGWEFVTDPPVAIGDVCSVRPDGAIAVAGSPVGYLATVSSHRDYRLHAEWRWIGKGGNGGALVHISTGPKDRQWPVSFQVQWKNTAVGDLLPMAGASFAEALSTPPGAKTPQLNRSGPDSERAVGEWNACDITCRGGSIEVVVNGVGQNRVTGVSVAEGKVGFQLEGTPFELRHVSIAPIGNQGRKG
jgi:hypothetical protein